MIWIADLFLFPFSGNTWNDHMSWGGFSREGHAKISLLSLCVDVYTSLTLDLRNSQGFDDAFSGQRLKGGRRCGPSVQVLAHRPVVSTHNTRRKKMSHFTRSWKEQRISLCHLQLLLSAGAWCVEGKCSGRPHGLVWGLLLPLLKSLSGQGLSYLQKKEENSRDGCD